MKSILALSVFFAASAFAAQQTTKDVLRCSFTEPFYSLEFDANTGIVTSILPSAQGDEGSVQSEVIASAAKLVPSDINKTGMLDSEYTLVDAEKGEILKLDLNLKGSDGMSEMIYPFEVYHGQNVGGCWTDTVRIIDTQAAIQKLMPATK